MTTFSNASYSQCPAPGRTYKEFGSRCLCLFSFCFFCCCILMDILKTYRGFGVLIARVMDNKCQVMIFINLYPEPSSGQKSCQPNRITKGFKKGPWRKLLTFTSNMLFIWWESNSRALHPCSALHENIEALIPSQGTPCKQFSFHVNIYVLTVYTACSPQNKPL